MKLLDIIKEQYSDEAVNWIKDHVDINKIFLSDITKLKPIIPYHPTNNKPNITIPLIVDDDNFIEDGNHRYFYAKNNNIDKLPVLFIPNIPSHLRKLVINHLKNFLSKYKIDN